jgi:NADH-quinone oxidoreductase subunit M
MARALSGRPGGVARSGRLGRLARWAAFTLLVAVIGVVFSGRAMAAPPGGGLVVSLPDGSPGPLVLTAGQGGWVGVLTITNLGTEPLGISRIAIRGDDDDVRSPSRLSVRFADGGGTSGVLAPGAARDAVVAWMPDRNPRVRQAFGHVVVTSTDEGAGEVAVGFRAQLPTGLGWVGAHALSLLVLLPLLLVPFVWVRSLMAAREPGVAPAVPVAAVVLASARLLLALWACHRFSPAVAKTDGNDGFQLVERVVWVRAAGSEWYLGLDGTNVTLVVIVAVLGLVATLVACSERRGGAHHAALALLTSALCAACLALDLGLIFVSWTLAGVTLVALVGEPSGERSAQAAAKVGLFALVGGVALLLAFVALSMASEPAYLVDGSWVAHTMAIPELARTSFAAKAPVAGVPFIEAVWVLLLVAAASAAAAVPLHGWLPDALEHGPASAGILAAGASVALGPYLLVRVGLEAVPEGARWLAPTIATLGAASCLAGALCALAQRDLRRFVAYATVSTTGACLYGVGALTAQGLAGAAAGAFAHGLAVAMLLGGAVAFEQRARTCDLRRLGGAAGDAPGLFAIVAVGLGVSAALPGLVGGWGLLLTLLGGFPAHPALGGLLAVAAAVSLAAHGRVARLLLFGAPDPGVRSTGLLASLGGRIPDATPPEVLGLVPLAALALLLGLWPAPLLSTLASAARDASGAVPPSPE